MKKCLFFLFIAFFVCKMSFGQFIFPDVRYEYHPRKLLGSNIEMKDIHTAKIGLFGFVRQWGKTKKNSFEWKTINFNFSSDSPYGQKPVIGFSFLDFVFRREMGRISPFVSLDLLEINAALAKEAKPKLHNSIAGGIDFYLNEYQKGRETVGIILSAFVGLTTYGSDYLSPFAGIGLRREVTPIQRGIRFN